MEATQGPRGRSSSLSSGPGPVQIITTDRMLVKGAYSEPGQSSFGGAYQLPRSLFQSHGNKTVSARKDRGRSASITGLANNVPIFVIQGALATQFFTCESDDKSY
jgi:hypothetical protein